MYTTERIHSLSIHEPSRIKTETFLVMARKKKHASSTCSPFFLLLPTTLNFNPTMRSFIILSLFSIVLMSCEETIPLDLDQTPSKIVIDGIVTNRPGRQSVKVTRSAD